MGVMLCIDGLPLNLSSKNLRELAEAHGEVTRAWIVTEPGGQASLRFGYVEAATSADADKIAKELPRAQLNNKPVSVTIIKKSSTQWLVG
jgi:RNA recognition motif. (a.k.a. RRM, RBD, or RNP domain)